MMGLPLPGICTRQFCSRRGNLWFLLYTCTRTGGPRGINAFGTIRHASSHGLCRSGALSSRCAGLGNFQGARTQRPRESFSLFRRNVSSSNNKDDVLSAGINHSVATTPDDMTGSTVHDALKRSVCWLKSMDVSEPESSVTQLLAQVLELPWSNGFVTLRNVLQTGTAQDSLVGRTLTPEEGTLFLNMMERRARHEPIQYILGKWDFLDFTLHIRAPLLCPRPETEELVEYVVKEAMAMEQQHSLIQDDTKGLKILDIGCGTGAIGIGIARLLLPRVVVRVVAIDVEPVAVEISTKNAANLLMNDSNNVGNVSPYEALLCSASDYKGSAARNENDLFDIVVSNPPYIPRSDMVTLSADVLQYESDTALCGGHDGMDIIRDIVHKLPMWCRRGGSCWMEVDPSHPSLLKKWLDQEGEALGVSFVNSYKDLFGRDRFVKLKVI